MLDDFAIFICTHGRPDRQSTLNYLLSAGYSGKWYLVLDDTDFTIQEYINNYGAEHIFVFDKNHYINNTDVGTNCPPYKCIVYAKNAVEDIANDIGLKWFIMTDDDIANFRFRYPIDNKVKSCTISDIDSVIMCVLEYMNGCNLPCIGFSIVQMYFQGVAVFSDTCKFRVPYTFVFRNANYKVRWQSWFGEDIITALTNNKLGYFWTIIPYVQLDNVSVGFGSADGGMADVYRTKDSFKLAMCDFIYHPSSIRPYWYKNKFMASIKRLNAYPMLVSSVYRRTIDD